MSAPVIQFDYDFSPYGQKTRLVLTAAGVNGKICDQPALLPRKDLEAVGITYRRIPLLAVGKDVYCDTNRIIDVILASLGKVPTSSADIAYAAWGDATFAEIIGIIPHEMVTPEFVADRRAVFPTLARPDFQELKPSGLAMLHQRLKQVEEVFLGGSKGPFINGEMISLADIHIIWPISWAFDKLGVSKEPGVGRESYPKVWKLIESLPEAKLADISAEDAQRAILQSQYTADGPTGIQESDPLGIPSGTLVTVESFDTIPGAHPQVGKLVATSPVEAVIELDNGIRLHFPRIGYVVKKK